MTLTLMSPPVPLALAPAPLEHVPPLLPPYMSPTQLLPTPPSPHQWWLLHHPSPSNQLYQGGRKYWLHVAPTPQLREVGIQGEEHRLPVITQVLQGGLINTPV